MYQFNNKCKAQVELLKQRIKLTDYNGTKNILQNYSYFSKTLLIKPKFQITLDITLETIV